MADDGALSDQAWAAATEIVDKYMHFGDDDGEARLQVIALTAAGWLEGRQAGGNEARAVVNRYLENL